MLLRFLVMRFKKLAIVAALLTLLVGSTFLFYREVTPGVPSQLKVYWFIPDGLRADPDVFQIYEWARQGHLPNLKKMMDEGSYGYSIPVYPGHTPTNFATLFTGEVPKTHGISDGPLRPFGYPLSQVTRSGFSSVSKKKEPIWYTLEQNNLTTALVSVPGSTPPETTKGSIVKGRWSNWGVDFQSVIFQSSNDADFIKNVGFNDRSFGFGKRLSLFRRAREPDRWRLEERSFSPPREVELEHWGFKVYALLFDSQNDQKEHYDCVLFSPDRKALLLRLCEGQWSGWLPVQLRQKQNDIDYVAGSFVKIKVIRLGEKDFFRFRFLYDGLNDSQTVPQELFAAVHKMTGPMVDFVDNFPAQLIHFVEDKKTFLEEMHFSFDWHQRALHFFIHEKKQDVIIQNIYSPNQMLTSRWWMRYLDPQSVHFAQATPEEKEQARVEVLSMYKRVDDLLGEALKGVAHNVYVVLSSDHGIAPLNSTVRLNNFFHQKGWLKYTYNERDKKFIVDWARTKVIFLQSNHVFLNPKGLGGNSEEQSGEAYEKLRSQVYDALMSIKTPEGESPFEKILTRQQAGEQMSLATETIGDFVIVSHLGYLPTEDITASRQIFEGSLTSGYKQTLDPRKNKALWTPFVVYGPGIRRNHYIEQPLEHVDQYRFIMDLLGQKSTSASLRDLRQEISAK